MRRATSRPGGEATAPCGTEGTSGLAGAGRRSGSCGGRRRLAVAVAVAALLGTAGCASLGQPATPIASMDEIAGRWQGLISFPGRFDQLMYLTIAPDGRLFAQWGSNSSWGHVILDNGRARFQMQPPPFQGDLKFYASDGRKAMILHELWGSFIANLRPQG